MRIVRIEVFDAEHWAQVDGLRPPATDFIAYVPAYLEGAVEVSGPDGAPFLRVEPTKAPEARMHNLSAAIVNAIRARLPACGPYVPCADAEGYERRLRAAREWLAGLPSLPQAPLLRWRGRDVVTPIVCGVLERLVGSYSLAPAHATELVASMAGAPPASALEESAARLTRGGTWPADADGLVLDEEARQVAEANRRSDEARERNAREATKIVEVVVGEAGIEGWRCRVCVLPPFPHLQVPTMSRVETRPPTHVEGGWAYWLRHMIPGEPLPSFTLDDGSGTVPRDTVLHMTKAQLAGVDGCWRDVFEVRALREGHGAIDRRPLAPEEMIGAGDEQYEALAEHASALITQHLRTLFSGGPQRLHVVSALVRGLLLRPDVASELLWSALSETFTRGPAPEHPRLRSVGAEGSWLPPDDAPAPTENSWLPQPARRVELTQGSARIIEEEPQVAEYPRDGWQRTEVEAACLAAAEGREFWSWHTPGALLEPLRPTLLQRLANVVRQDPWLPVLRSALRERQDDKLRTPDVVALLQSAGVDAHADRKADTVRLKTVLGKMGWTKREFEVDGERFRAYAREVQP